MQKVASLFSDLQSQQHAVTFILSLSVCFHWTDSFSQSIKVSYSLTDIVKHPFCQNYDPTNNGKGSNSSMY